MKIGRDADCQVAAISGVCSGDEREGLNPGLKLLGREFLRQLILASLPQHFRWVGHQSLGFKKGVGGMQIGDPIVGRVDPRWQVDSGRIYPRVPLLINSRNVEKKGSLIS